MWGGHSCPPPLTLILTLIFVGKLQPKTKPTPKAADKSVRPTYICSVVGLLILGDGSLLLFQQFDALRESQV
jgi:hypothetical protein